MCIFMSCIFMSCNFMPCGLVRQFHVVQSHRRIQGANPAMPPSGLTMGLGPPAVKDFYHTKMAHILVSVYSVFFQPHSTSEPITINNIHIIDLVYTCIITSSDSSLAPSLSMTDCTPSDHLLHFH